MNFAPINLTVQSVPVVFSPFDKGANGAFVYRMDGQLLNAQRLVIKAVTNDTASDRYSIQTSVPRVSTPVEGCCPTEYNALLGTDLVSVDMRFLATTSDTEKEKQIHTAIEALKSLIPTIKIRGKIYS